MEKQFNKEEAVKKKAEIAYRRRMIDDQYPMEDTFIKTKKVPVILKFKRKDGTIVKIKATKCIVVKDSEAKEWKH